MAALSSTTPDCRGQAAALAGGTTMHIDFVLPVAGNVSAGLASYRQLAARSCMDYGFHVAITEWSDVVADDMTRAVAEGVNSFKFFLAYKVCRTLVALPLLSRHALACSLLIIIAIYFFIKTHGLKQSH